MRLIRQPKNSQQCGQACVAMIAGVSLSHSLQVFGWNGCTSVKRMVKALTAYNISLPKHQLTRMGRNTVLPNNCILKLRWTDYKGIQQSHWVVKHGKDIYDPGRGGRNPIYNPLVKPRFTSYLEYET